MATTRLTNYDAEFMKQLHITPEAAVWSNWLVESLTTKNDVVVESTPLEEMLRVLHEIQNTPGYAPPSFIISAALAREIAAEYGEVNWGTFQQYITGRQRNEKKK